MAGVADLVGVVEICCHGVSCRALEAGSARDVDDLAGQQARDGADAPQLHQIADRDSRRSRPHWQPRQSSPTDHLDASSSRLRSA